MQLAGRIALVVIAAGAIVVLAVGLHASQLEAEATEIATRKLDRVTVTRVLSLLREAEDGNHDTRPLVLQAQAMLFLGRETAAIEHLETVVRREPDNVDAWRLLVRAAGPVNPRLSAQAQARVRELSPPVAEEE